MTQATPSSSTPTLDLAAIKTRQQATWSSGDFAIVGTTLQIVGETVCEAIDLRSGEKVLDVACGNGNAALAAARRFAKVTALDYVPALLAKGKERGRAEAAEVEWIEGDAEALPFADASFDAVISTYGVMFAPDHVTAASELLRVCRPGGRIGLACWTPEGFIGELLRTVGRYVPPPAGLMSPSLWGKREHLAGLFGTEVTELTTERKMFAFRYESAAHFIDIFRRFYGPTHKAYGALDPEKQAALTADITALIVKYNRGGDRKGIVVPGEYLETVAVRR